MPRYEVALAHEETGDVVLWNGDAADPHGAVQEAQEAYGLAYVYQTVTEEVRHPEIEVSGAHVRQHPLTSVKTALRIGGVPAIEILDFEDEALTVQDHTEELLKVIKRWVTIT